MTSRPTTTAASPTAAAGSGAPRDGAPEARPGLVDPTRVPPLSELTTLRLGGPPRRYVETGSSEELAAAVRDADAAGERVLVLGGGSNVVVPDAGFDGVVIRDVRLGMKVEAVDSCGGSSVEVPAGTPWTEVVDRAVEEGWVGVEALAGIPGSTGATPVQNVGAYGQEVSGVVSTVRVWDRQEERVRTLTPSDLAFGYRTSLLKRSLREPDGGPSRFSPTPRYVVLDVGFQLRLGTLSAPIGYGELARLLGVEVGDRAPLAEVRAAVLQLRTGKGMVLDPDDHDTWSAGSFFTNPVIPVEQADRLPDDAPRYPVRSAVPERTTGPGLGAIDPTLVKTSAAWLIERAGFGKGHGTDRVSVSTKHALALTNRGGATTDELLALAREVRDGVAERFGIVLVNEPVLVGCEL